MMEVILEYITKNFLEIVGIIVVVIIAIIGFSYNRRKEKNRTLNKYYEITGKKSSKISPEDVLGDRPFNEYYYQRPEDGLIVNGLNSKKNVLIVGPPLSGKSRAAYQALKSLNKPQNIIIPRCTDIDLETFLFPKRRMFGRPRVMLIDDLHRFMEQQNFDQLFRVAIDNDVTILATCRSAVELKKVENKMLSVNIDLETVFGKKNIVELGRVSEDVGKEIANEVGVLWADVTFDGNVGSVFMRLAEMGRRFDNCDRTEKTILRVMRNLYICGIYEGHQVFPLDWVKTAAKRYELEGKKLEWTGWLESLKEKEFITLGRDRVQAEEVYLEYIVKPEAEIPDLAVFQDMLAAFLQVPEALFRLGHRAYEIGTVKLEKAEYMKIAIIAYNDSLKVYTLEDFPMQYGTTQNNLGTAYGTLGEVEAKAENCKQAIKAYEEALKVRTLEDFPMDYAMTQNNLGNAYRTLGEVETKAENCKQAIKAYEEALKVYTEEEFPEVYPLVAGNLRRAFDFCKDAM